MYNILTPTEVLLRELFDIQQMLNQAGASQESKEVIAQIGVTAFNNLMGETNNGSISRKEATELRDSDD